jgi:hypothetical protein
MVRVEKYFATKDEAMLDLYWHYRNYPSSVLSVYETTTQSVRLNRGKNLCTTLDKVWCVYGTKYGND